MRPPFVSPARGLAVLALLAGSASGAACSMDRAGSAPELELGARDTGVDSSVAAGDTSDDTPAPPGDEPSDGVETGPDAVADGPEATDGSGADAIDSDAAPPSDTASPCTGKTWGGHTYWFCKERHDWHAARASCLIYGTDLAVIASDAENGFVNGVQKSLGAGDMLIGHTDSAKEGTWVGVDGVTTYTHWATFQPDDFFGEDCGSMYDDGKWNDVDCGDGFDWFVCETT